jgi:hypothetical protein
MIRALLIACLLAFGLKVAFAVASFAKDQHAARIYILNQGAR